MRFVRHLCSEETDNVKNETAILRKQENSTSSITWHFSSKKSTLRKTCESKIKRKRKGNNFEPYHNITVIQKNDNIL